ncbi:uncharacterized protein DFL_002856 [Arthrobotrys flagrans]|uniref:MYND-type domain-containing protein n=1 Tax=Arthrobotrys flagrans TaxID=97331 RepID=A0A437ACZ0_ARTFL|nr:hypothetical protein DFL_002856 [Arthrobotrys flagrans]
MLHAETFDRKGFYYPIGNSPAINLVGYLPQEINAEVLLLGCGDVRNVLFTLFTESSDTANEAHRKYHFTCCDVEGAVIARNILLMAMILKNEESSIMWPIYYDVFMSEKCSEALKGHLKELLSASEDIYSWLKSDTGKVLTLGSRYTLAVVRRFWSAWVKELSDKANESQRRKSVETELNNVVKNSKGSVISLARSAGPLVLEVLNASSEHFYHYWKHGTTELHPEKPPVPNPTFALSKYGKKFSVHYGTNPLAGFHLSTAVVPFAPKDGPASKFLPMKYSSDFTPLVTCAKEEFNLWCQAFRKAQGGNKVTLCFFVDEALELCGNLSLATDVTGIKELNETNAISKGYLYSHPTQFNVIDISNLIDHIGTYNILLSVLSLLRKDHISYLSTETLLNHEFDLEYGNEALYNVFGVDPASLFALLGIAVVDFMCGQSSISQVSEYPLEAFGKGAQRHSRLVWKWIPSFQPEGINEDCASLSQRPRFTYDTDAMIEFLAAVYKKLFAIENAAWSIRQIERGLQREGRINFLQHNTRATYSLLLQKIKRVTSETVPWDDLVEKLVLYVTSKCGSLIASCFLQEQDVLNHLHCVKTADILKEHPSLAAFKYGGPMGNQINQFEYSNVLTCVTLSVPIRAFHKLTMRDMMEIGNPQLQITLSCGILMNQFCALHRRFGKLDAIDSSDSFGVRIQKEVPTFKEDLSGWIGTSDILYSCMVPTWLLLLDGCKISLAIVVNPMTTFLIEELGPFLNLFEASVLDHKKVRLSTKYPLATSFLDSPAVLTSAGKPDNTKAEVPGPPKEDTSNSKLAPEPSEVRSEFQLLMLGDKILVKLLEDRAAISITKIGSSTVRIHLGPHSKLVAFPFPVGEAIKLSVARKSKYIEINASIYDGHGTPVYYHFPVGIADKSLRSIVSWHMHRINLDKSPAVLIDLTKHGKINYEWINTVATFAFSKQERANINSSSTKYVGDLMSEIKETIHMIIIRHLGIQGFKNSTFLLSCVGVGGYMVIYVKDIRVDLTGQSITADCALIPLEYSILPQLAPHLVHFSKAPIMNSPEELKAWLQIAPSLVERCRTWKHKPNCEYLRSERVPSSAPDLEIGEPLICSCGKGIFPKAFYDDVDPTIKFLLPYATRAALGPLFPPPYSKELQSLQELIPKISSLDLSKIPHPRQGKRGCALCGKEESGDLKLMRCSACRKVEYCSKECQKKDWKAHKKTH